jgi:hypothetical protein
MAGFRFFDLARELRDKVYEVLLDQENLNPAFLAASPQMAHEITTQFLMQHAHQHLDFDGTEDEYKEIRVSAAFDLLKAGLKQLNRSKAGKTSEVSELAEKSKPLNFRMVSEVIRKNVVFDTTKCTTC